jgi:hypothetical protein
MSREPLRPRKSRKSTVCIPRRTTHPALPKTPARLRFCVRIFARSGVRNCVHICSLACLATPESLSIGRLAWGTRISPLKAPTRVSIMRCFQVSGMPLSTSTVRRNSHGDENQRNRICCARQPGLQGCESNSELSSSREPSAGAVKEPNRNIRITKSVFWPKSS